MPDINRQWILKKRPIGRVSSGDLELVDALLGTPGQDQALIRNTHLSLDPTHRNWMNDRVETGSLVQLGGVMRGGTLGIVQVSNNSALRPGDVVRCLAGWEDYSVVDAAQIIPMGIPPAAAMSVLGITGLSAYFGLLDIGRPQPGETVVVSAAAGAVGSIAGQIAKIKGCRVVGIAGSDEKCRHVIQDLGFDACINYKRGDLLHEMKEQCPDGIDVDFENVGGDILATVVRLLNVHGRIVLCGMISTYNTAEQQAGPPLTNLLMKRALIRGFSSRDYTHQSDQFIADMQGWLNRGMVKYKVHLIHGLENAVDAFGILFDGGNVGKLLVEL